MDRTLRLSAEQKCDIAQREIEEFRDEINTLREESEKVVDNYKVDPDLDLSSILFIGCIIFFID